MGISTTAEVWFGVGDIGCKPRDIRVRRRARGLSLEALCPIEFIRAVVRVDDMAPWTVIIRDQDHETRPIDTLRGTLTRWSPLDCRIRVDFDRTP